MIPALSAKDQRDRHDAAFLLRLLKDSRAIKPLVAALDDPDASVRGEAADSLRKLQKYSGQYVY